MFLIQLQPLRVNDPGGHIAIPSVTRRTEAVTMCLGYIIGKVLAVLYSPPGAIPNTEVSHGGVCLTVRWDAVRCGFERTEPRRITLKYKPGTHRPVYF